MDIEKELDDYRKQFRVAEKEIPKWLKRLGCFDITNKLWRFSWGEINWVWGLAFQFYRSGDDHHWGLNFHLLYPEFYLKLPIKTTKTIYDSFFPSWGGSFSNFDLHLNWGDRYKILENPFKERYHFHETLLKDMTWYKHKQYTLRDENNNWEDEYKFLNENAYTETHPYYYLLNSGKVQETKATIRVERWTRKRPWLHYLFGKNVSYCIGVTFADEVGERAGSWKGGCIGCSYDMKPGEIARTTLNRMQNERRFS